MQANLNKIRDKYSFHSGVIETLEVRAKNLEKELQYLANRRELLKKADIALEALIKTMNQDSIGSVEKLISEGLEAIFETPFEFRIKTYTKRGILNYDMVLVEDGKECDILNSSVGGVASVISVLLRIVTILVVEPPRKRLLVLDEALAQLGSADVENASNFLKKLGQELDFTIVMITHEPKFTGNSDILYYVKKVGDHSEVEIDTRD